MSFQIIDFYINLKVCHHFCFCQILKKMYDEDLEEFTDEVKHMLDKEFKKSQETVSSF